MLRSGAPASNGHPSPEHARLQEDRSGAKPWRLWGPYLSDRQWGTVREDYSPDGAAWNHFTHDQARSRAYRWGEDGIAGISDDQQRLCFSIALWNGRDPILKERFFGLAGPEGNHGEDVKEVYYYLDATPTHSYLKMLYKYPQGEYPYARLVEENRLRNKGQPEFELHDAGAFDDGRYFDVFVEYAKASPTDVLIQVTVHNRGPDQATLHLLPHLFFRNTWSWTPNAARPSLRATSEKGIEAAHPDLPTYTLTAEGDPELLFTENESNAPRLWNAPLPSSPAYYKDAFHDYVVHGNTSAVNPARVGTKAAAHYVLTIPSGQSHVIRLGLRQGPPDPVSASFDQVLIARRREADFFYSQVQRDLTDADARLVQRQAFASLIWSRQFYHLDIPQWVAGDPVGPPPPSSRRSGRNTDWPHLNNADIISMPDKWEYPWYAAWDLAFHCVTFAHIDPEFAKSQLVLMTREWYMHPNGQLPAYEWAFGDVNPPVHAWAAMRVYEIDRDQNDGKGDLAFLERLFHKLLLNFTWWVNRKDAMGRNIFQGGFLGLDNIGVFDRSAPLPTGGYISQCDGTSWMAMYSLNLMRMALELSKINPIYQDTATKFFEHFLYIAAAMSNIGDKGLSLWCDRDEFFYDVLCLGDNHTIPLKVRSMVGLIPLFAVEVLDCDLLEKVPEFKQRLEWFLNHRSDLAALISRWHVSGKGDNRLLSLLRGHRMKRLLKRMLDETEFLSPYGVRALSKCYHADPYRFHANGNCFTVSYQPGESDTGLFGGNSNWRGPIWMPVNFLLIESLRKFHSYYGDDFKVECPTGSGSYLTIDQVADELMRRLSRLFLKDERGVRPSLQYFGRLSSDPHFADYPLFFEYFHGETGRGVGASHQTGWTALMASLLATARGPAVTSRRGPRPVVQPLIAVR